MESKTISKKTFNSKLFQKCKGFMFMFVCLPSMFAGMQIMSSVFTLFIPKYRCRIPFFTNDTFETQGRRQEVFVNKTIPMVVEGDDMSAYSQCEIYKTSLSTSYSALNMPPSNTSTEQCNKWVYDSSVLKDTFITQANLVCKREIARANANMIYFSGMMTGALVIGLLSDMFGRKKVLIFSTLMHVGGAFGSAFATDYIFFVAMRFIIGVSCTGMYTSSFVLGMELVIPSKRVAASYMLDMAWCVGLYILCFLAYVTRSWDMILLVMASLAVLLFVCLWIIPESPRWLKSKGRFIEANAVILEWENINGKKALTDTSSKNTKDDIEPESVLKMCTIPNLLIRTLLIYLNWFVIIMVNFGISLNVGNMDGDLFVNFAIISSMEMLAYTFCFLLLNKTGRKRLLVGTLFFCGGACILSVFVMLFFDKCKYFSFHFILFHGFKYC
ncbi:organic cation transporter protein-like [Ruditapes philippinarum]|uniref:organic cation transporter protein-like n=1 Tax=Ruditapes philippinarum TaxID=129788 RepID=UPI00295B4B73|nr:organic cation transporter protein-like [Ruditapes philippinarum]